MIEALGRGYQSVVAQTLGRHYRPVNSLGKREWGMSHGINHSAIKRWRATDRLFQYGRGEYHDRSRHVRL